MYRLARKAWVEYLCALGEEAAAEAAAAEETAAEEAAAAEAAVEGSGNNAPEAEAVEAGGEDSATQIDDRSEL